MSTFRAAALLLLAALALPAAPAAARDLCLGMSPVSFTTVFKGVKKLKPGGAVPLSGFVVVSPTSIAPVHGSAVMDSAGQVKFGVTIYLMADSSSNLMLEGVVDRDFNGTATADLDGNFVADAGTLFVGPVDCKSITIP